MPTENYARRLLEAVKGSSQRVRYDYAQSYVGVPCFLEQSRVSTDCWNRVYARPSSHATRCQCPDPAAKLSWYGGGVGTRNTGLKGLKTWIFGLCNRQSLFAFIESMDRTYSEHDSAVWHVPVPSCALLLMGALHVQESCQNTCPISAFSSRICGPEPPRESKGGR